MRQLTDAAGVVTLAKDYMPYGEVFNSSGNGTTSYGFTGEWTDASGLIHLRARQYAPSKGRFISRDVWDGDTYAPMSYNRWLYGYANPSRFKDPSGEKPWCPPAEEDECIEWTDGKLQLCDKQCLKDATTPLASWEEIYSLPNPTRALFMRALLSEVGWRLSKSLYEL